MKTPESQLYYLAVPYSHASPTVMEERFAKVNIMSARLMEEGHLIFSPISHTHPIARAGNLPTGWEYWQKYDRAILSACRGLLVYTLDGWDVSKGVQGEIAIATELGLEIGYVDYDGMVTPAPRASSIGAL